MVFGSLALVTFKILVHNVKNSLMSYRRLQASTKMIPIALKCLLLQAAF